MMHSLPENATYENRMLILINIVLLTFMATLDGSIVNVALPEMARSLSTGTGLIAWVVTSYLLTIVAAILVFGKLGDSFGMSRVFLGGVALFSAGSLLCGFSDSFSALIVARIVQGVGAAGAMATNQGLIAKVFPPSERGKALGIAGSFVALGTLAGPPLGGFITDALSWKFVFLINVPIGLVVLLLGLRILPKDTITSRSRLDIQGSVLFALATTALFGSIIFGGKRGYGDFPVLAAFAAAVVSFALFVRRERRIAYPLLDLSIFRNSLFSLSLFCAFLIFVAISASSIVLPFYLQNALRMSPSLAGLFMMVYPLVQSVVAPLSGRLSDRIGSESLTFAGLLLSAVGLFLMSSLNEGTPLPVVLFYITLMSVGNGMFHSPNTSLIMSSVSPRFLGVAGSLNGLIRNFGMIFGVSAAISLLYGLMSTRLGRPVFSFVEGRNDVFFYGMRGVYISAFAVCVLGALLTAYRLYSKKTKTAALGRAEDNGSGGQGS